MTAWMDQKGTAKYLSVSVRTVQRWTDQGKLRSYRFKGKAFYKASEIDMAIEKNSALLEQGEIKTGGRYDRLKN